jgi:hypothetical protein
VVLEGLLNATLGTTARWKLEEFDFTASPVEIDSPLKITWHGRYAP